MSTTFQILPPAEVKYHFIEDKNKVGRSIVVPLLELSGGTLPRCVLNSYTEFCDRIHLSEEALEFDKNSLQKATYYLYVTELVQMLQGATKLNAATRQRNIIWLIEIIKNLPFTGWNTEIRIEYFGRDLMGDLRSLGMFDTSMAQEYRQAIGIFSHNSMNKMEGE